jgi:hypothetical protein
VSGRPLQAIECLRGLSHHSVRCVPTYCPLVRIRLLPFAPFISLDILLGIQIEGVLGECLVLLICEVHSVHLILDVDFLVGVGGSLGGETAADSGFFCLK